MVTLVENPVQDSLEDSVIEKGVLFLLGLGLFGRERSDGHSKVVSFQTFGSKEFSQTFIDGP